MQKVKTLIGGRRTSQIASFFPIIPGGVNAGSHRPTSVHRKYELTPSSPSPPPSFFLGGCFSNFKNEGQQFIILNIDRQNNAAQKVSEPNWLANSKDNH